MGATTIIRAARAAWWMAMVLPAAASAADLLDVWRQAQARDPAWHAAEQALAAGQEKAAQGDALLKPQVQLASTAQYQDTRTSQPDLPPQVPAQFAMLMPAASSGAQRTQTLSVVQALYQPTLAAARGQLHEQAALAQVSYQATRQDLLLKVARNYFSVLLAQQTLDSVLELQRAVAAQLASAQARFDAGRARITDVREAEARRDAVAAQELAARIALVNARAQLEAVTGVADALADVAGAPPLPPQQPAQLTEWQQRAEQGNLQVRAAQGQLALAQFELDKNKLSARPAVDLVAGYSDTRREGGLASLAMPARVRSGAVGVQLTVPLYAGGGLDAKQRAAIAGLSEAQDKLAMARRDARLAAQQHYLSLHSNLAQVGAQELALASARLSLQAGLTGLEVGIRTSLDVLNLQQQVAATRRDLAQARYNYLLSTLDLAAACGELDGGQLEWINRQLAHGAAAGN